jgi:protein CpxP
MFCISPLLRIHDAIGAASRSALYLRLHNFIQSAATFARLSAIISAKVSLRPPGFVIGQTGDPNMSKRNKTIATLAAAGVLGLAAAGTVVANPWDGGAHKARCEHHAGKFRTGMHRVFKQLDLTEAQRDQLFEIRHNQRPALREKMKELRQSRQALRALATADTYDADRVREAAAQQAQVRTDLTVMRTETMHKMFQVLTPEQKQKLAELRQRHEHRFTK